MASRARHRGSMRTPSPHGGVLHFQVPSGGSGKVIDNLCEGGGRAALTYRGWTRTGASWLVQGGATDLPPPGGDGLAPAGAGLMWPSVDALVEERIATAVAAALRQDRTDRRERR